MKVKTISRNPEVYERAKDTEDHRIFRNYDPEVHPFERAREYRYAVRDTDSFDALCNSPVSSSAAL